MAWSGTWTTAADLQGRKPENILSQVREALAERCAHAEGTPTPPDDLDAGQTPSEEWFNTFQARMTTLISLYANHSLHGGDYSGQSSVPSWTQSTMLTAISASTRLSEPDRGELIREWAWQQYKLLNLMRWPKFTKTTVKIATTGTIVEYKKGDSNTSWLDAESNFSSASWVSAEYLPGVAYLSYVNGSQWRKLAVRWRYVFSLPGSLVGELDLYGYAYPVNYPNDSSYFYPISTSANYRSLSKLKSSEMTGGVSNDFKLWEDESVLNAAQSEPGAGGNPVELSNISYRANSTNDKPSDSVWKLDGTNGFTYKDW